MKYRDTYRIVTRVSRYVSHRELRYRATPTASDWRDVLCRRRRLEQVRRAARTRARLAAAAATGAGGGDDGDDDDDDKRDYVDDSNDAEVWRRYVEARRHRRPDGAAW